MKKTIEIIEYEEFKQEDSPEKSLKEFQEEKFQKFYQEQMKALRD